MRVLRGVVYMTKSKDRALGDSEEGSVPGGQVGDLNQLRTEPWIPNQDERRVIKMSWSIVLKAAERSSRPIGKDTIPSVILLH